MCNGCIEHSGLAVGQAPHHHAVAAGRDDRQRVATPPPPRPRSPRAGPLQWSIGSIPPLGRLALASLLVFGGILASPARADEPTASPTSATTEADDRDAPPALPSEALAPGSRMDLAITTRDGRTLPDANQPHRLIVVVHTATWLDDRAAGWDHLVRAAADAQAAEADRTQFIVVPHDPPAEALAPRLAQRGLDWPVADLSNVANLDQWKVRTLPHVCLFGVDGRLHWRGHPSELTPVLIQTLRRTSPIPWPEPAEPADPDASDAPLDPADPQASAGLAARQLHAANAALAGRDYHAFAVAISRVPIEALDDPQVRQLTRQMARQITDSAVRGDLDAHALRQAITADPDARRKMDAIQQAQRRPGSTAGRSPGSTSHPSVIRDRLEQVRQLQQKNEAVRAYELLQWIVSRAATNDPSLPAARELLADYDADPAFQALLARTRAAQAAAALLRNARTYQDSGQVEMARQTYRQILADHPDTREAEHAKAALAQLR